MIRRLVVMGVSGSGKSAVGADLAARFGIPFLDGDDLHPAENVAKMSSGTPLTDEDRMPWLRTVAEHLAALESGGVIACSALARRYREHIRATTGDAVFVELRVPTEELDRRMRARAHFMPPALLASQLAAWEPLEPDEPGVSVENVGDVSVVVARVVDALESVRQSYGPGAGAGPVDARTVR